MVTGVQAGEPTRRDVPRAVFWELFPVWAATTAICLYNFANVMPRARENPLSSLMLPVLLLMGLCVLAYFFSGLGWASLGKPLIALAILMTRAVLVAVMLEEAAGHWFWTDPKPPLADWFYPALLATLGIPIVSTAILLATVRR